MKVLINIIFTKGGCVMGKQLVLICCVSLFLIPLLASAYEPPPYSQLELRPYDPKVDPDIDMYISHWKESTPYQKCGSLIVRDIFTRGDGDPLHPKTRGAVLEFLNQLSYAKLQKHKSTPTTTLRDEQIIFYIDAGKGALKAGDKVAELKSGVGIFMPAGLEFTMSNDGDEPLTMYLISEPVHDGFKPISEMLVKDESTMPINTTQSHWSHILRVFFYGDEAKRAFSTISGMCPVWFDPMTMGQPHSHKPGDEEVWFVVEGEIILLLGKELRKLTPGSAFKIPPNGTTPHSTINVSDETVKLVWFMSYSPGD